MTRERRDQVVNGCVWNGFDDQLQVWVLEGIVQPCGHPDDRAECCQAKRYAGMRISQLWGREHRA